MESQTLSIKISTGIYRQLKDEVGKGKISKFIEKLPKIKIAEKNPKNESKLKWQTEINRMTERIIKRGDIYKVALDPAVGREIKKTQVVIKSEGKERKILTDQIRSVDRKRIREYKGKVSYEVLAKLEKALCIVLALRRELQEIHDLTQIPTKTLQEELMRRKENNC
ncbi:5993_t:CDS:2 [Scutellospora calospora]|uniref:5993_t:CDS:1 n=1 Tax=Scutellospora calospora TaxID=85575 RepID=A0ACA9JV62_9GLOM|nr:5993_t:CDS:2 [Scutellospora calospora]